MAILGIISAGTKVQQFEGQPIMKVGASNTLKLNREALNLLGVDFGDYIFIAPDGEDKNVYYIAGSKEANTEQGDRGSKLGLVGEKGKSTTNLPQLQFNHAALGKTLFEKAAVFAITENTKDEEGNEIAASFEYNGLTFYPMTILQSREDAVAEKESNENAKQEAVNAQEDKAAEATTSTGRRGRGAASAE